ncbi:MAG: alpha/beta fold hydrolase [Pseudomonadales bacterium]|nr:alpha/beta fold hydrolase [Pseudomonadales bacterium]
MRRIIQLLIVWLCLVQLSGCTNLFFLPQQAWLQTPADLGYDYENIMLPMSDGLALNLWYLPSRNVDQDSRGSILFFHGNAQNISTHINAVFWFADLGFDVYLLDYRGFGKSQGWPDLPLVLGDIAEVSEWFLARTAADKPRVVLGQSMGASMAGYVMATRPDIASQMSLIILESGFADYRLVARQALSKSWLTWAFQYPLSWTVSSRFSLVSVIDQISPTPLLILHGLQDPVVAFEHAEMLEHAAKAPAQLMRYTGGHIAAFTNLENRKIVVDYIESQAVLVGNQ